MNVGDPLIRLGTKYVAPSMAPSFQTIVRGLQVCRLNRAKFCKLLPLTSNVHHLKAFLNAL